MLFKVFIRLLDREDHEQPPPFLIDSDAKWTALQQMLSTYYDDVSPDDLDVRYWDEEDFVIISSQEELDEAFRLAEEEERSYLQLHVRLMDINKSISSDRQSAGGSSLGTAVSDKSRREEVEGNKEIRGGSLTSSMPENTQPTDMPKIEMSGDDPNGIPDLKYMYRFNDWRKMIDKKKLKTAKETDSSSSDNAQLTEYLLKHHAPKTGMTEAEDAQKIKDRTQAMRHQHSMAAAAFAGLQEMVAEAGDVSYDEGPKMEQTDDDEPADCSRFMMPGASSGANAIAIEMPEMEHQATETAEPAEVAETGEMSTKSSRDAETGFWMQPLLEAEIKHESRDNVENQALQHFQADAIHRYFSQMAEHMPNILGRRSTLGAPGPVSVPCPTAKRRATCIDFSPRLKRKEAELRRKLSTLVTEKERAAHDYLKSKKLERRTSSVDSGHKKKKHHKGDSAQEESVNEFLMKENSSSSITNSSPLSAISEEMSSDTPLAHHKKHERKASKSEGKKKKHHSEPLTKDSFVHYMTKFETQMRKDIAKEVAKKTVRSVIKNLPKQSEGSETASNTPVISSQRSGHVHDDIICDCCDREIIGTRYMCGNCANYDLCEECENIQPSFHDRTHVFIKLRRPCLKAGTRHGLRVPLLKRVIYEAKDEERIVDPERIQVIMERTKMLETQQAERRMSKNNNNSEEGEGDPDEQQGEPQQEEDQMLEKAYGEKVIAVTDCGGESSVPTGHMADDVAPQENIMSTCVTDGVEEHTSEQGAPADGDEEDGDPDPQEGGDLDLERDGDFGPEFVEDGFVMCMSTQDSFKMREMARRALGVSPSSSIEVVNGSHCPDMSEEDALGTHGQEQEEFDVSSLGSLTDETSSEEDFVVIVPDCFDISKPLDPASLSRLTQERTEKLCIYGNQAEEGSGSHIPTIEMQSWRLETDADFSGDEVAPLLPQAERDEASCTHHSQELFDVGEECSDLAMAAMMEARKRHNDEAQAAWKDDPELAAYSQRNLPEGKGKAVDVQGEESALLQEEMLPEREKKEKFLSESLKKECDKILESNIGPQADIEAAPSPPGDTLSIREAIVSQTEASAAVDHSLKPASKEKILENQNHSFSADSQDAESSDVPDDNQTDLKHPPESEEDGAAAAADGSLDPEQQLNEMMTNTIKKASSGLQHLLKAGKDIFKTFQSGECYEPKESSYVFKPSDYKLPENTWQPSKNTYVMPKSTFKPVRSDFQMPKSTYTGPQSQVVSGYGREYALPLHRIQEMGYFNNERTLDLLRKYDGDVQKVVNELVEETDNEWAERRHGDCLKSTVSEEDMDQPSFD